MNIFLHVAMIHPLNLENIPDDHLIDRGRSSPPDINEHE
jgi:hypothetical protein